jgi:hypothetical protein
MTKLEMQHDGKRKRSMLILFGKSYGCKSVKRASLVAVRRYLMELRRAPGILIKKRFANANLVE